MTSAPETRSRAGSDWRRPSLTVLAVVAIVVAAVILAAAFLPRWWSHRIGAQVAGSITTGTTLGLFYGFVFTAAALAILRWTFRKRRTLRIWTVGVIVAIVLAGPNLLTLGIVLGSGDAAHAGERTLDVEAPGFRNASLIGALAALAAFAGVEYLIRSRRRARSRVEQLQNEQRAGAATAPDQPRT